MQSIHHLPQWLCAAALCVGCAPSFEVEGEDQGLTQLDQDRPLDQRVARSAVRQLPPIVGGTLILTRDGGHAVVSDPDTDAVVIVDLRAAKTVAKLQLAKGSRPGRAAEDAEGRVHITLRGSGELLTIDPATRQQLGSRAICRNPRGIASDDASGTLLVACASGKLLRIDAAAPDSDLEATYVAEDLRDVFFADGVPHVSQFHSARVLELDDSLAVVGEWSTPDVDNQILLGQRTLTPNTAWRTIPDHHGGWFMLHQASANIKVLLGGLTQQPDDEPVSSYGGGSFSEPPCHSLVASVLSRGGRGVTSRSTGALDETVLAVDAALSPTGDVVAVAVAGQSDGGSPTLQRQRSIAFIETGGLGPFNGCWEPEDEVTIDAQPVAVAYDADGWLLVQTRAPVGLYYLAPKADGFIEIELGLESIADTGFDLFHNDAGAGIACASCHPEGGNDGLVWTFEGFGPRRTQALDVGLRGTEPFHWEGDMENFGAIVGEVHLSRMGGARQSPERIEAFESWLLDLEPPRSFRDPNDAAAERGRLSFEAMGCAECHSGPKLTNNATVALHGYLELQVPTLVAIAHRAPYMHDGRSADLFEATIDMLERTGRVVPQDEAIEDVVAYLETL